MTDKQLSDNEIIKALEICASGTCEGCKGGHGYDCVPLDMGTILSLINRQKAEIERLTKGIVHCKDCKHIRIVNANTMYAYCVKTDMDFEPFQIDTRKFWCCYCERKDD